MHGVELPVLNQKERDIETGLDYFFARYYSSVQGRFTSPDGPLADQDASDPQTWNLYSYTSNSPLNRIDEDGQRWFYKCGDQGCDVQWVNPNKDGSYTSPGDGYQEFIPTKERPNLVLYSPDGYKSYSFGEREDGSPRVVWRWTGKIENRPEHIIMAVSVFQDVYAILRGAVSSFAAWRAARQAETTVDDILANAAKSKVSKSIQYTKSGGMNQANKDFDALVGQGGNIINRGGGLRTATLKDGTKVNVRPFSSGGKSTLELQPPTGKVVKIRYE